MKTALPALVLLSLLAISCARKEPAAVRESPKAAVPEKPAVRKTASPQTVFERGESQRECAAHPAKCDGTILDMDVKKSVEKEIDPASELKTEFCVGGCSKKSILNWSLEWK